MKTIVVLLLLALVICSAYGHKKNAPHKVLQLSSVPKYQDPTTYNNIPISIWSDGSVFYTTAKMANPGTELAAITRQVLTGKINIDDLAELLLFMVDNEYTKLENKYEDASKEASNTATCLTVFEKSNKLESCEKNDNAAPKLFQQIVSKIRDLVATTQDVTPLAPKEVYVRAYSISKNQAPKASLWRGPQLFVDRENGVWLKGTEADVAWTAANEGSVFDYQGQYVQLTAQVRHVSLIEPPMSGVGSRSAQDDRFTKLHFSMLFVVCFAVAWAIAAVVYFSVRSAKKCVKEIREERRLEEMEQGEETVLQPNETNDVSDDQVPFLVTADQLNAIQAVEQQQPTQYFYLLPQNTMVQYPMQNAPLYLPNNGYSSGPFLSSLPSDQ